MISRKLDVFIFTYHLYMYLQEKQRKSAEDQRNPYQQQAQAKAQMLRYEDDLARKRMLTDHKAQRRHDTELVKMQEESSIRKEQARRATEEQMQLQQRRTEKERAELEPETIGAKAMAEVEEKSGTFNHIEGDFRILLTDMSKLLMTIGGVTALAAGVYAPRILGQPSLIRESSMAKISMVWVISRGSNKMINYSTVARAAAPAQNKSAFGDIILQKRIEHLARATGNTKTHQAPFCNMIFYWPPGTCKTKVARES
ncbi:unnamed protein product [Fraxinus pennsylvanica]|uniref:ATPase family AAA domain-containing protein n=1 Tax=Fraxinus pennsylvanica TaxID=56036 RepID=A0AAD2A377_9LAMI|nr:unnamed protein product [Fraxinus pennsylvanica]